MSPSPLTIVGIGADGWAGLAATSQQALHEAQLILGAARQLALLPDGLTAERRAWPSPMEPEVDQLAGGAFGDATVLASGDPMLHGIGAMLVRKAGVDNVTVLPHVSSFALACARMGWPEHEVELVSIVARPPATIVASLQPGRRIVAFVTGEDGAARLAQAVTDSGGGESTFTLFEQLGGRDERRTDTTAAKAQTTTADPLHLVAIQATNGLPRTPGLPDDAYEHDGQLTKRHVRAITVAALAANPHELLWDVGAGAGSIAIEWLRAEPSTNAIAIENNTERAARITANAGKLGVPRLQVAETIAGLPTPDVVFVGGGIAELVAPSWDALKPGGRIVANAVTLEGEQTLAAARAQHGGDLTRIAIEHAEPLGGLTGWRPQRAVTQWSARK
jgi:precorrin-6Y C5,15-methyltransferase (decarboxylating)